MKMRAALLALLLHAVLVCDVVAQSPAAREQQVWSDFVALVRSGGFTVEKVKPYEEMLRQPVFGFIEMMRARANWDEWTKRPRIFRVGPQVHYILPMTFDGERATYCFSFLVDDSTWYLQHLETIMVPMDKLGALPLSRFPDLPERQKAWMRDEIEVSQDVRVYNTLVADHGVDAALDWFNDGRGYALGARAWVPYVTPERAFILYFCWERANLHGETITLQQLDDTMAVVKLQPRYLQLYRDAAHLKLQIREADYRALFESRWRNRAAAAGWNLAIECTGIDCMFRFARAAAVSHR